MQSKSTRHISLIRWTALALLALSFIQLPVRALQMEAETAVARDTALNSSIAQSPHQDLYLNIWITGLARGQTLRYTWVNLNDPDPQQREFEPLRIQVKLFAASGSVIAQAEAPAVDAGKFQSFDFNHDQINLPGEAGTGRLQVRLEVTVSGRLKYSDIVLKRGVIETFDDVAEIIDTHTGRTTSSSKPKEIVVVGSKIRE